ncbi:MAG TPA: uroporphyrinogen-III synthase, partial [Nitrososphaerales archaeon]|nr:uroporphyrinogen-III synthase [Nitrososphaerales archaeon]
FQRLEKLRGERILNAKFACVGPQTEAELRRHGAKASFIPKVFLTESLGEELSRNEKLLGKKILLARAESANNAIKIALDRAGAIVTEAPVYRTVSRKNWNPRILDGVTDITLTSPSTVEGLLASVGAIEILSRKIKIHCIGPVTARKARDLGLRVDSVANVHTIEGLTAGLLSASQVE